MYGARSRTNVADDRSVNQLFDIKVYICMILKIVFCYVLEFITDAVTGVKRLAASVCVCPHDKTKVTETTITKLAT